MIPRSVLPYLLLLGSALAHSQSPALPAATTLPVGTPLPVQISNHLPMRVGQQISAQLIYPVYADDALVLPEHTTLTGTVVALRSNHSLRIRARLNGDFTPFRIPVVQFTQIVLTDGTTLPIATGTATDGAPIYRLVAPPPRKGGFIRQQFDNGIQIMHDQVAVFTGPDKRDRFVQFFYHQIPYHPQRIEKGTAWTVETSEPLSIPLQTPPAAAPTPQPSKPAAAPPAKPDTPPTWIIQAYLDDQLSSATAKAGQTIKATVAEPIYNEDHTIAVPQGAIFVGEITKAKPARSFARAGTLRFDFSQIELPNGNTQNVQAALTGVDSAAGGNLAMNSEGQVKPKPQDKLVVPLILALLASRALDQDREQQLGKNTVAANGFGLAGNIIGLAGHSPELAAGIGFYGTAVAFYYRWIAPGKQVTFARNTRIVLQTTARRAAVLKPNSPSSTPR